MILTKTETGYATKDGRWTVEPVTMGDGPRNKGREWRVTDTHGKAELRRGGHTLTVHALYAARDLIAAHMR